MLASNLTDNFRHPVGFSAARCHLLDLDATYQRAAEAPADVPSARPVPPAAAPVEGDYARSTDDTYDEEDLAPAPPPVSLPAPSLGSWLRLKAAAISS